MTRDLTINEIINTISTQKVENKHLLTCLVVPQNNQDSVSIKVENRIWDIMDEINDILLTGFKDVVYLRTTEKR